MENASKALILAGAVLISILIISLGVYIFNVWANPLKDNSNMDEEQIKAFNAKIAPYLGDSIAGSQVNALLQYCLSSNMSAKKEGKTSMYITVTGASSLNGDSTKFDRVNTSGKYYKVEGTYDGNGLCTQIKITPNS